MKNSLKVLALAGFTLVMMSCDNEASKADYSANASLSFEMICNTTGGVLNGERCRCGGVDCRAGEVCNTSTNRCPIIDVETFGKQCVESGGTVDGSACVCNGEKCAEGQVCNNTGECPEIPVRFAELCILSGGTPTDNICQCSEEKCSPYELCNFDTKKCLEIQTKKQRLDLKLSAKPRSARMKDVCAPMVRF